LPIDAARFSPRPATHRAQGDRSARLLVAAGVSAYGDWLTVVALAVLLFRLTHEPEVPAAYVLAKVAPRVLGPTPGGYLADRFGPGRVAGWCALVQGLLTAAIVAFAATGAVWPIFASVIGAQFVGAMAQPGYSACIPRVARPARLMRINAIYSGLFESSVLVSPALGALLLTWVQPSALIAVDAASFLVAGTLMLSLRIGPATTGSFPARDRSNAGRIVATDPALRALGASFFCSGAAITALQAVLVVAAAQHFGQDATVGWLYAAVGAGGAMGSAALLFWKPAPIGARGISIGFLFEVAPFAGFALVGGLFPALGLLAFSTCAAAVYQTRGQTALQQNVPADVLGRVNGVLRLLLYSGMLAGAIGAVTLVDVVGWSTLVVGTTAIAAGLYVTAMLVLQVAQRRPGTVMLVGTPVMQFSDRTGTASRTSRSIGRPAELPHPLDDPS
jgi:hypothetical protein